MYEAEKHALEEYIFNLVKSNNSRALKVAVLTRDISSKIEEIIIDDFIDKLDLKLNKNGIRRSPPLLHSFYKQYDSIRWRSPDWRKGWFIGIEFGLPNLREAGFGFCAPDSVAARDPAAKDYDTMDGELRLKLVADIRKTSFKSGLHREWPWWPAFFQAAGLRNWLETECLLKLAGVELHDGVSFVDWLADDLDLLYRTVDKVLSEQAPPPT
ncbi:hypothetical protein T281_02375 [Rhodomicrobium udaipurense JA643]|uniref:Uncharacterized protein n=1 Tax=Rhodomicrobium udaipurense TaxID=1202716 RepID=A0A8I1GJM4_9HYPH|nr:hypothetical protein [Rhodomicrobium udaipurense]KAI96019.1 hypothetical protein T281_02375 [Rhodomicrobium udaipurense JA643]MBJ7544957.1 hypothetical protein [Rhodomicrobium udaipurense]